MDSSPSVVPAHPLPAHPGLSGFSLTSGFRPSDLRLHSRRTMLALSHLIEDQAIAMPGTVVLAAFQRFSYFAPQQARYAALTHHARHVYVFGLPDVAPPTLPNLTYLPFAATSPLLHEWFVLALGPSYSAGLFARDMAEHQPLERTRRFAGLWSTNVSVLDQLGARLELLLGAPLLPTQRDYSATHRTARDLQRAIPQRLRNPRGPGITAPEPAP